MLSQKIYQARLGLHFSKFLTFGTLFTALLANPLLAADGSFHHRTELTDGKNTASIVQEMIPNGEGFDTHIVAEGPNTGATLVAIMHHDGDLEVFDGADDEGWWSDFLTNNGLEASATPVIYNAGGQKLFDLLVFGTNSAHLIGHWSFDPDQPWGECPGRQDEPTCWPVPVVIGGLCKFDFDQCGGGPLPLPGSLLDALAVQDPDVDPAITLNQDPDGDPAWAHTLVRFSADFNNPAGGDLGVTTLSVEGSGEVRHLPSSNF